MEIHQVKQQSEEWFKLRRQFPLTASNAQAIGNNGKGLETLCWDILSEKYSSGIKNEIKNEHLDRGNELESQARELYMLETGTNVIEVGFITNKKISKVGGASPDGLVNDDGLLEIKAFADTKHFKAVIDFKKTGKFEIESQYMWQVQMQLLFAGRKFVDFVAYCPNYHQSLLIQRVFPDLEMQKKLKEGLKKGEQIINEIETLLS